MGDYGRGLGQLITFLMVMSAIGGIAIAGVLLFGVPWIFHHLSIAWR